MVRRFPSVDEYASEPPISDRLHRVLSRRRVAPDRLLVGRLHELQPRLYPVKPCGNPVEAHGVLGKLHVDMVSAVLAAISASAPLSAPPSALHG